MNKSKINYFNIPYEEQLAMKQAFVKRIFQSERVEAITANPKPMYYRHKVTLSAVMQNNKLRLGQYEENTKTIKPKINHAVQDEMINLVFGSIEKLLNKYKLKAYNPKIKQGIIKHVMIRKSFAYGQYLIVFVTQGNLFPNHQNLIKELVALHPEIISVVQNIHFRDTPIVLLSNEKVLYGTGYIYDQIDDYRFRMSARSFYQVNPKQMINLYKKALLLADIKTSEIVCDAYCGIGTMTLLASPYAKEVIGIDVSKSSIEDAIYNKQYNQVGNVDFIHDDVEKWLQKAKVKVDCLIMDPTRHGATEIFLKSVLKLEPKRIVYVSCDIETQKRDIDVLLEKYRIDSINPFDMFSYTDHVESITLLSLK